MVRAWARYRGDRKTCVQVFGRGKERTGWARLDPLTSVYKISVLPRSSSTPGYDKSKMTLFRPRAEESFRRVRST